MPQNNSRIQSLLNWAKLHQTNLHSDVEIYHDATSGLSFRAIKAIPPGAELVNCSYKVTLSYLNAIDAHQFPRHSEPFPESFLDTLSQEVPNIIGHFFLIQQYLMQERSFWWHYVRLLPQPEGPIGIPIWWPEADQRFLDGTNAEPQLKKRTDMWKDEWGKGIAILQYHFEDWKDYTYNLYQWAATIYGSRSFRASLTIPEEMVLGMNLEHVRKDRFSILLPVVDLGNHNGINNVDWRPGPAGFTLSNRGAISLDNQIFNYYGNKSNSELLVAYGFTLPSTSISHLDRDSVNLKLKPKPEALALRRTQNCHVIPAELQEEFLFAVQKRINRSCEDQRLKDFMAFSDGFIDLVICMVANKREKRYLSHKPQYCPEKDLDMFASPLARCATQVVAILKNKLDSEIRRIKDSGAGLGEPLNSNQRLALDYRNRQSSVLSTALYPIATRLDFALSFSSFCQHDHHIAASNPELEYLMHMHLQVELLSLECAFEWLRINYLEIFTPVIKMISEDQDEPLPLNWAILVTDWDHTYWVVWIFTVWMLWAREGEEFRLRHKSLESWLLEMNRAYDEEIALGADEVLYSDTSEKATIDLMIQGITTIGPFSTLDMQKWLQSDDSIITRMCNFASFVAQEETFSAPYKRESIQGSGPEVEQKLLCINKGRDTQPGDSIGGSWTRFLSRCPGFWDGFGKLPASMGNYG